MRGKNCIATKVCCGLKLYCRTPRVYCKIVSAVGSVVLQYSGIG